MRTPIYETIQWLAIGAAATLLTLSAACGACDPPSVDPSVPKAEANAVQEVVDLFVFGRMLGTISPCGCTTEPLGGLNYAFGYIENNSSAATRLVLEPGSFLFPAPDGPEAPTDEAGWAQAKERAALLQKRFKALGDHLASGVGPTDLSSPEGMAALKNWSLPRTLANVDSATRKGLNANGHRLIPAAGGTIGITTAIDPNAAGAKAIPGLRPLKDALGEEISAMRKAGADLVIVQFHAERPTVEALIRELPGIDIAIVDLIDGGDRSRLGTPAARIGDTWILEPGEQAQTITHLRLTIEQRPGQALPRPKLWTVAPPRATVESELVRVEERLKKFQSNPNADPGFIRNLEAERQRLKTALAKDSPTEGPAAAVFNQVKVTCKLQSDERAASALEAYDAWVAEQNHARFVGVTPPEPAEGDPRYVGIDECETCHDEAYDFWKTTRHAGAYKTLVDDNKQFDLSCVGCHVTGFRKPGGSEVVENHDLQSVQCEQCHGPGSFHIDDPELEDKPNAIRRKAPAELCRECHTAEHSDTFEYNAYLRDILGPGHGETSRIALGEGPTGHGLREAGFAKAGGACTKNKMGTKTPK